MPAEILGLPHWNHVFTNPAVADDGSTVSGTISVIPGVPVSAPPEAPDPEKIIYQKWTCRSR